MFNVDNNGEATDNRPEPVVVLVPKAGGAPLVFTTAAKAKAWLGLSGFMYVKHTVVPDTGFRS